ncbi:MAG: FkbM family methyltransferase [Oscillospiraceae bacterium]|nr:FkbM family methyltransferase [Oscillospiraceae bacterium]
MSIKMKEQALIWGAGYDGLFYKWKLMLTHDVVGWVDNDIEKQGTIVENIPVYSATDLLSKFERNTLIVVCCRSYMDIQKQLYAMGFINVVCSNLHVDDFWSTLVKGIFFPKDAESYSVWGEDLIVDAIFKAIQTSPPKYAEVGVAAPVHGSNTYLFYKRNINHSGILVEPDISYERYIRLMRPSDKYISVGIGVDRGTYRFLRTGTGVSTFCDEMAKLWCNIAGVPEMTAIDSIQVVTFDDVFLGEGIQYLSIDIEGWDKKVLCSIDFQKYPELLVVVSETQSDTDVRNHMLSSRYAFFASTRDNEIYIKESILEQVLVNYECRRIYDFMKYLDAREVSWML